MLLLLFSFILYYDCSLYYRRNSFGNIHFHQLPALWQQAKGSAQSQGAAIAKL